MTLADSSSRAMILAAILLGACAPVPQAAPRATIVVEEEPPWRSIASAEDSERIDRVGEAWRTALTEARSKGFARAIIAEGNLLRPIGALLRPAPTPGPYRCRTIKLGSQDGRGRAFNAYKPFFCYIEAEQDLLTFVKQTGSQRPAGRLYADTSERRLVFLGTLALGTEEAPLPYGERADRDMVGVLERISPFRFRLLIPWPRYESKLDVIELVPVTE